MAKKFDALCFFRQFFYFRQDFLVGLIVEFERVEQI